MKICTSLQGFAFAKALFIAFLIGIPCAMLSAQDCIYTDFTYTIGANGEVKFKDISSSPRGNIVTWEWRFGDGSVLTQQAQPTHRYNITNTSDPSVCFDATLKVTDGANTGLSEVKHICIPTSTQSGGNSLYVKITSPTEVYDGSCNNNTAKVIVNEQTSFEATVLGGTPPYTYNWTLPNSALPSARLGGPGPHLVKFPNSGAGACPLSNVSLQVTDSRGVRSTSNLKISIRGAVEGPGKIKITANKTPICAGEEIVFKGVLDNPFSLSYNYLGVSVAATYRWLIDGVESTRSNGNRLYAVFTEGNHQVKLEIKDGSATYYAEPLTFTVKSLATCNVPIPIVPDFELRVNGAVGGTLELDANNRCTDKTNKIVVRVPARATFVGGQDCLPNYFFSVEIVGADGKPRKFINPTSRGYSNLNGTGRSEAITDVLLNTLGNEDNFNYIKTITASDGRVFKEFTLPICFANCGPLTGCNQLNITVGRYSQEQIISSGSCTCASAFPDYLIGYMGDGYIPNCNFSTPPLIGKVGLLKTLACAIKIKDNYDPLSISGIQSSQTCSGGSPTYKFQMGDVTGGSPIALDPTSSYISCTDAYKNVRWKAYHYSNPNREITEAFIKVDPADPANKKKIIVEGNHVYFNSFGPSEPRLFIIEASVADADGNVAKYSQIVSFEPPPKIMLPDNVLGRCPSNNTPLSNQPIVLGGTSPIVFQWSSTLYFTPGTSLENPSLNLQGITESSTRTLTVTDGLGCSTQRTITIQPTKLGTISLGRLPLNACANGTSVLKIGPTGIPAGKTLADVLGGSGEYYYKWMATPSTGFDNISDPTIPYPTISANATGSVPVDYYLTIFDALGGCSTPSDKVTVQGWKRSITVNLGQDKVLCPKSPVNLVANTTLSNTPNPSGFTYQWTSTDPNFSTSVSSNQLPLSNLPSGSKNTYTVTAVETFSSCAVKDDIQVEVRKDWTYKGYESKIMPIRENNTGLLWQVNDSEIFVNGNKGSGAVPNFTYTTTPALTLYTPQYAPYNALQQSLWSPSLPAYTPSAIVTMTDGAGCKKDFPTNTFYILKKDPVVTVSTDKKVICSNGDLCLYLSLKLDVVEATKKYLPTSFIVGYSLRDTRVGIDGTWGYYGTAVAGNDLEFVLTDPNTATYTAIKCVKVPSVVNLSYFTFVVDAGLPNSTAGNGTFSIAHRFAASPTGPIRLEYRAKGTFSTPQTRVVAFNRVYLGSDNLTGNRAYLRTSGNAYTEYSAGTRGDVLMQYDIDIQNTTQYFHAFIDPCLVSAGKIKEEDTEIIQSLKSSTTQDLSGVFNAFPNPFTNDITLNYEVRNEKGSQVSITLYNGLGQLIDKPLDTVFNEQRVFSINYNGSKLTPGIYLFELNIDGNKFLKKVIKKN